jgi:two-component system LytT family response regulator
MDTLKAIVVEDEERSRQTLINMVNSFCEGVSIIAECENVETAVQEIKSKKPDLVFLDIELPGQNGFELLDYFQEVPFEIIFTTAYNHFAIKAFKLSAIDYLLKPIDLDELRPAIDRAKEKLLIKKDSQKFQVLKDTIQNVFEKVSLPTMDGLIFVDMEDIVRCEAQNNYTMFYLENGETHLVSKTLKYYEEILNEFNFFRINRTDIINLKFVKKMQKGRKILISLVDGTDLSLADTRKESFMEKIGAA